MYVYVGKTVDASGSLSLESLGSRLSARAMGGGKYIIQCKRYTAPVAVGIIRDLFGVVTAERASKGVLVTNSRFTREAKDFAAGKPIELVNEMNWRP